MCEWRVQRIGEEHAVALALCCLSSVTSVGLLPACLLRNGTRAMGMQVCVILMVVPPMIDSRMGPLVNVFERSARSTHLVLRAAAKIISVTAKSLPTIYSNNGSLCCFSLAACGNQFLNFSSSCLRVLSVIYSCLRVLSVCTSCRLFTLSAAFMHRELHAKGRFSLSWIDSVQQSQFTQGLRIEMGHLPKLLALRYHAS